ncbi:MAG: mandelate racemase/muconate lactonizing enzyme family protein [Alphaproteobacteria bacterium]|nr:mandelate racemase/muconate lactonizing enzyme family protein [Alphaproteobacteria bacterium]
MKITGIETICLRYAMPYALTYARGEYATREALLVKVHTSDPSIVGWGEAAMWGGPFATSVAAIEQEIAPLVIGEDPRRIEYLWEKAYQETYYHGRKGILLACLSGVDIALWDILGKCAGQPVWRLLGGFGRPVAAYASAGYYRRDYGLGDFAADVAAARAAGYHGYKMKVGNVPDAVHANVLHDVPLRRSFADDIARVKAAREAIGADRWLMCDATTSLSSRTALRYAEEFEKLEVRWFEEPTQSEDVDGCAELARRTRVPIAGFETETGRHAFARLIDAGAIQIVQPDVVQVGGLTEARKIAAYAQVRHLTFTAKNYSTAVSSAATLNLLYAIPNGQYFECDQDPMPLRDEILTEPLFRLDGGWAEPFDRPGLGLAIDETRLDRWRVKP